MGGGIAMNFLSAGIPVTIVEQAQAALDRGTGTIAKNYAASVRRGRIRAEDAEKANVLLTPSLEFDDLADCDLIIEAAFEEMAVKKEIFARLDAIARDGAILASNTSVIPITTIMEDLDDGTRALGTHWWNPPHMIPLVEVIRTQRTAQSTIDKTMALLESVGKTPVRVDKDVAGFIGNRLQHALWREAIYLVESGVCTAEAVDQVVNASFGRRLSVLGPLANADLVGTDLTLDIHENVLADLDNRPEPSPYLRRLVEEGKLGMKSGEGFRSWTPKDMEDVRQRVATHLRKLETILED